MLTHILVLLIVVCLLSASLAGDNFSQRRRRSKELEEKINKLDTATKSRIHAMKASGMPKEAIAEKIAYQAGDMNTAKRIVDALHDDPTSKVKPTTAKKVPAAKKAATQPTSPQAKPTTPKAQPTTQTKYSQPNSMPINFNSKMKTSANGKK